MADSLQTPNILVSNPIPKGSFKLPSKKVLILSLMTIAAILGIFLAVKMSKNIPGLSNLSQISQSSLSKLNPKSSLSPSPATKLTVRELLNGDIKIAFDSKTYPTIISLADQATKERDQTKRYGLYLQAFQQMSKAYATTKNQDQRQVMFELKNYVVVFPDYKSTDFPIPK